MMESYDQVVKTKGQNLSVEFRFRNKRGTYVKIRTVCFSFQNPFTDEPEYIVCNNTIVRNKSLDTDFQSIAPNGTWSTTLGLADVAGSPGESFLAQNFLHRPTVTKRFSELPQTAPVYMGSNPVQSFSLVNFPSAPEDRTGQVRIPSMEANNYEFNPRKLDAMGTDKGSLVRFGLSPSALERSQFMTDESRFRQTPIQYRQVPSTTAELSEMQRLVSQGSYLNNNVDINNLERSLDVKPALQHMSAYDAQISSANPLAINPSLMTSSAAGNRGYPYSNCHI
ncbi:aryl hydrocarbon receptor nuclear translocator homolog [Paramuricea clavata]|uniref:Aryl hydrocarbon receptor nuclear translocator homolog n=1 Tax=Paramuricea clavata TaxID=317549 RepID=A0A7D9K122_PARCT|nr:aryl hydrocarbon receptor nuclear translocator homolog [Paramuricea clavata]